MKYKFKKITEEISDLLKPRSSLTLNINADKLKSNLNNFNVDNSNLEFNNVEDLVLFKKYRNSLPVNKTQSYNQVNCLNKLDLKYNFISTSQTDLKKIRKKLDKSQKYIYYDDSNDEHFQNSFIYLKEEFEYSDQDTFNMSDNNTKCDQNISKKSKNYDKYKKTVSNICIH